MQPFSRQIRIQLEASISWPDCCACSTSNAGPVVGEEPTRAPAVLRDALNPQPLNPKP